MLEMKLTLIALLRTFKFHTTVELENIRMNMGFLMTSSDGYKMSITSRGQKEENLYEDASRSDA